MEEKMYLRTMEGIDAESTGKQRRKLSSVIAMIVFILVLIVVAWKMYDVLWLRHRYLITAYCDCPICINIPSFRDGKFASRRPVYWGGVAADKSVPFGASVELLPFTVRDWWGVHHYLGNRRHFIVEDRGGKIRGRHIDIFFSESQGGHQTAVHWGIRRMRVKINGRLMD